MDTDILDFIRGEILRLKNLEPVQESEYYDKEYVAHYDALFRGQMIAYTKIKNMLENQ